MSRIVFVLIGSLAFAGCVDPALPDPGDKDVWGVAPSSLGAPSPESTTDAQDSTGAALPGTTSGTTTGADLEPSTGGDIGAGTTGDDDTTGSTGSTGSTGTTGGSTGEEDGPPSFKKDMWPLVFPECGCHVDENAAGGLYLGKEVAYDNLVGVESDQAKDMLLIDPGSPDTSYVWHKLKGTHDDVDGGEGKLMPPGGSLEPEELDLFRAWIEQGAQP